MAYSLKLLLIILITLPVSLAIILLGPFDPLGKRSYRISRLWTWGILKAGGIRVRVKGLERLDPSRQYIFMANHQSNIDIPVLVRSLSQFQLRWVAKKELLFVPLFGWAMWASKHIVVDRTNRSQAMASLRKAKERIEGGISVVLFPEGTRSADGQLLPFKSGGFILAVKTQTPIVPIAINGSGALLPRGDWRIRGGEVEVVVSEPIVLDRYRGGGIRSLLSRVRAVVESQLQRGGYTAADGAERVHSPTAAEARAER